MLVARTRTPAASTEVLEPENAPHVPDLRPSPV
jgi:hypothetical protein